MIATWMFETADRHRKGVGYPTPFYDLAPVLIVQERILPEKSLISRWEFPLRPFSYHLWGFLFGGIFLFVGLFDAWNDGRIPSWKDHTPCAYALKFAQTTVCAQAPPTFTVPTAVVSHLNCRACLMRTFRPLDCTTHHMNFNIQAFALISRPTLCTSTRSFTAGGRR